MSGFARCGYVRSLLILISQNFEMPLKNSDFLLNQNFDVVI